MRFAFVSGEGNSLSWWMRLQDEGEEVGVWISNRKQSKDVGQGLVDSFDTFEELARWGMQEPCVFVFDLTGMGHKAEWLKARGQMVVCGGQFCDKLESDRSFGEKIAQSCGILLPADKKFKSISEAIKLAGKLEGEWVFKSDKYLESDATYTASGPEDMIAYLERLKKRFGDSIPGLLQEKIDGVALSTAGWFTGQSFLEPFLGTIEHKKFMNDDVGPSTGCSLNMVTAYDQAKIVDELHFDQVAALFRQFKAPAGIYDINAVISSKDKKPYFLEWTPRFGYDSEPTCFRGLTMPLGEFFTRLGEGRLQGAPFALGERWAGVRLSHAPYPHEFVNLASDRKETAIGTPVRGNDGLWQGHFQAYGVGLDNEMELVVTDPLGLVGVMATTGTDVTTMFNEIRDEIEKLEIPGLQFRTDAADKVNADIKALAKLGYEV